MSFPTSITMGRNTIVENIELAIAG